MELINCYVLQRRILKDLQRMEQVLSFHPLPWRVVMLSPSWPNSLLCSLPLYDAGPW